MIRFTPLEREAMAARHAARRPAAAAAAQGIPAAQARNLAAVLDLGNTVFFVFQGRPYGVPPLPWREGAKLQALWAEALAFKSPLTPETTAGYYAVIRQLPPLLWGACRPVGPLLRLLRLLHLHRNPFERATEQELVELAGFFLSRRMRSGVLFQPGLPVKQHAHQT